MQNNAEKLRLVAYIRVSTDAQVDGYGLEVQTQALTGWAKAHGHSVAEVFSDEGVAVTVDAFDRDGLSSALEAIEHGGAKGIVPARLDRKVRATAWAVQLRVKPGRVEIAQMPNKWGSCTSDGVVTFADEVAGTEESFQDYVIVHELLHLRYRTHNKRFRAMMTALVPHWRDLELQSLRSSGRQDLGRPRPHEFGS